MTRALRLRSAFVWAVASHGLVALLIRSVPSTPPRASAIVTPPQEIAIEHEPVLSEPGAASEETPSTLRGPRADAPRQDRALGAAERRVGAEVRAESSPSPAASGEDPTAAADSSWTFDPMQRSANDLGIGSHWKSVVVEGAGTAKNAPAPRTEAEQARETARAIDRSMREMLTASDVERGLGRAGPLVSATHLAASSPGAPEVGVTILEVESDASGTVVSARSDERSWNDVAATVVRNMAGKPLRIRPGGRGLRARLRVVAERTLPAGSRGTTSAGAVPDDVPGGSKACVGQGATRRCSGGMPVGVSGAAGDTSNIGAKPIRVVHVHLVSESEL